MPDLPLPILIIAVILSYLDPRNWRKAKEVR